MHSLSTLGAIVSPLSLTFFNFTILDSYVDFIHLFSYAYNTSLCNYNAFIILTFSFKFNLI